MTTETIQEQTERLTNRGLRADDLVLEILKEEERPLSINEIVERVAYGRAPVTKALDYLVKICKVSHREISKAGKSRGRSKFEYFILSEKGLKLRVPLRKSRDPKRLYISKIIPNFDKKTMTLETNQKDVYEVKWIKTPIHEDMTLHVSTYAYDLKDRNKIKGLVLNSFIRSEEGVYSNQAQIKVYFKEEN